MIRTLAVLAALVTSKLAAATPMCPGPVYEVATLATPSLWRPVTPLPGARAVSVTASGGTVFAATVVDGTPKLLELADDRWQEVPGAPAAASVAAVGVHIYAFVKRDDRVEVSFARRGTAAWSPTTAPPEAVTDPFACGDALCASISASAGPGIPDDVRTYAATPDSTGALGIWTHVLSSGRGGSGVIGASTSAGSTSYVLAPDGTYANVIDPGGRYRALWNRVGPAARTQAPAAIAHDGWLFAVGGTVMDESPEMGKCGLRARHTASYLVYAARISADGSVGGWRAAAPLPRGEVARLVASEQQLYAIASSKPGSTTVDIVAIPWTEMVGSIAPGSDPPAPSRRIPRAPARRPYSIDIPADWIEVPAEPIDPDATFALEYRTKSDPRTTLHISWIQHRDDDGKPSDALANRLSRAEVAFFGNTGMAARGPGHLKPAPSMVIDEVLERPPHVRHLRMVGVADPSAHVSIAAAACTGIETELAACETILATLGGVESWQPPSRWPWWVLLTTVVVVASIWAIRRRPRRPRVTLVP